MTTVYKFKAYYTDSGVGTAQDPAPTCTVINMADDSKLADAQATTASTNMPGLYSYEYSGADGLDCVAWFKTTDTGCDVKQLASYVSEKITTNLNADVAGVETKLDTVDANVDAILDDTGTSGVITASGTVTTLTNLPSIPNNWITAAGIATGAIDADAIADNAIDAGAIATGAITNAKFAAGAIDAAAIATDAIDADSVKADAVTKIQTGLATPTNITAGTITTVTNLTNAPTTGDFTATMKSSITSAASSATPALSAAGVDAILDEVVVGTYTMRQLLKVFAAKMVGKGTGGGTTTITYRGVDDASNVIVETVDANGNRSAVTLTV